MVIVDLVNAGMIAIFLLTAVSMEADYSHNNRQLACEGFLKFALYYDFEKGS